MSSSGEQSDDTPDLAVISVSIVTAQMDTKTTGMTANVLMFCQTNCDKQKLEKRNAKGEVGACLVRFYFCLTFREKLNRRGEGCEGQLTPAQQVEEDDRRLGVEYLDGDPGVEVESFIEQPATHQQLKPQTSDLTTSDRLPDYGNISLVETKDGTVGKIVLAANNGENV